MGMNIEKEQLVEIRFAGNDVEFASGGPVRIQFALPHGERFWIVDLEFHLHWKPDGTGNALWMHVDGQPMRRLPWNHYFQWLGQLALPSNEWIRETIRLKLCRDRINDIDRRICDCSHARSWHVFDYKHSALPGCKFNHCPCLRFRPVFEAVV